MAGGYAAPMPDPVPTVRPDADCQPDLFDGRGPVDAGRRPEGPARPAPATLGDDELVGRLADAGPSDVDALCAEIVARSLPSAVPALERLWARFRGFGIDRPLREQSAVLETLARLGSPEARTALRRLVLSLDLPAFLHPVVLRTAVDAGLRLPAPFVAGFLGHADAAVRRAAFDLAAGARVSAPLLREGLSDPDVPIRRAAAVALADLGDDSGREVLLAELVDAPSTAIVGALGALGGDEAIVALGRCAMRHSALAPGVFAALREMGNPRAERLAARLEPDRAPPIRGGAP